MQFDLRTTGSNLQLVGGIAGLVGFQFFYFILGLPYSFVIRAGAPYWILYAFWGVIGLLISLRKSKNENRRTQNLFTVFFIVLMGAVGLTAVVHSANLFLYAFPGFWVGVAFSVVLILMKRMKLI